MLNKKEIEVIEYMDYQIMNNGIDGWLGNRGYEKLNEFIRILNKRNYEIDRKVAAIFVRATTAGLSMYHALHENTFWIPEIEEMFHKYETELYQCGEQYQQIAENFMRSYGLESYLTTFKRLNF